MNDVNWTEHFDALSSAPDRDGMDRRRFLQGLLATGAVASLGSLGWPAQPASAQTNDSILVVIMMGGGNDGMSMVIPAEDGTYQSSRGALAISPGNALSIGGGLYLNQNLPTIKSRFDAGDVAIIQGVGEPLDDHSHFSSMARWMSGWRTGFAPGFTGWLGRYSDQAAAGPFGAVSVGNQGIPLHMRGLQQQPIGLPTWGGIVGANAEPWEAITFNAMRNISATGGGRGGLFGQMGRALDSSLAAADQVGPVFDGVDLLPDEGLTRDLVLAARTINLDLGTRVVAAGFGDFDTHDNHDYRYPMLMTEFDEAIRLFYAELNPAMADRVTIMTFSEFGRSWTANDSAGIDHGTASTSLVIGNAVRGGMYGEMPNFINRDDNDDLHHRLNYRSVYASVIDGWLGGDSTEILGGTYEDLRLFQTTNPNITCEGLPATHWGDDGNNVIFGTDGADVIVAMGGNDRIFGGGGADVICAGDGNDVVIAGAGDDEVHGGDGRDRVSGGSGRDSINGEGGSDYLLGDGDDDLINGGAGADRIRGGGGNDAVFGGGGQDTIWGDNGADVLQGNSQSDTLRGGAGRDTLRGSTGRDTLYGGPDNDMLFGGDNSDRLYGESGADHHDGQRGSDDCFRDQAGDTTKSC